MSFFEFKPEDIINTEIVTHPKYVVELNGNQVTGSIFLDKPYLNNDLENRLLAGFSNKEGGIVEKNSPLSSSVQVIDAEDGGDNKQAYKTILRLYDFYNAVDTDYTASFEGSAVTRFRVINVPEIYYDRSILTGAFTASDLDSAGDERTLYDNGRGGIYSGSLTGTLVGNIFYNEGLVVFKGGGLNDEAGGNDFGQASPTNFKWKVDFKGNHQIPVKIFRCRAPAGQLNASTNPTYYTETTGSDDYVNERRIVMEPPTPYITTVGLYNDNYELVGMASVAQPVKKELQADIQIRLRLDF